MTHLFVAEFESAEALTRAAASAARNGHAAQDALTPFPLPGILAHLASRPSHSVGWTMALAGAIGAALAWLVQWYSATTAYPIVSGGRPFDSWQVFFFVSFEVCILFAAIAGFIALARVNRVPSLNHPLFEITAIERATQDRFFLLFESSESAREQVSSLVAQLNPVSTNVLAL